MLSTSILASSLDLLPLVHSAYLPRVINISLIMFFQMSFKCIDISPPESVRSVRDLFLEGIQTFLMKIFWHVCMCSGCWVSSWFCSGRFDCPHWTDANGRSIAWPDSKSPPGSRIRQRSLRIKTNRVLYLDTTHNSAIRRWWSDYEFSRLCLGLSNICACMCV